MKITHTTYEHVRAVPQTTISQGTNIRETRSHQNPSLALSQTEELPLPHCRTDRPLTMWPRFEDGMLTTEGYFEVPEQQRQPQPLETQIEQQRIVETQKSGINQNANAEGRELSVDVERAQSYAQRQPLSDRRPSSRQPKPEKGERNAATKTPPSLSKIKKLRESIAEGRIERVIPPRAMLNPNSSKSRSRLPTPLRRQPTFERPATSVSNRSRSITSPLSSQFRTDFYAGVQALDSKRREIVGRCRPSVEHCLNQAIRLPGKLIRSPSNDFRSPISPRYAGSISSFYCVEARHVESEGNAGVDGIVEEELEQSVERGTHDSFSARLGEPALPFRGHDHETTEGVDGLVVDYDTVYGTSMWRRSLDKGFGGQYSEENTEEEIKPTPPLKIKKKIRVSRESKSASPPKEWSEIATRKKETWRRSDYVNSEDDEGHDERKPQPPPKDTRMTKLSLQSRGSLHKDYGKYTFHDKEEDETEHQLDGKRSIDRRIS